MLLEEAATRLEEAARVRADSFGAAAGGAGIGWEGGLRRVYARQQSGSDRAVGAAGEPREGKEEVSYMYITPRTLLAIIRISQAMAKFHFRDQVTQPDVDQAIKLMDYSFQTLEKIDQEESRNNRRDCK